MQWGRVRVVEKEGTTTLLWVNSKDGKAFEDGKTFELQGEPAILRCDRGVAIWNWYTGCTRFEWPHLGLVSATSDFTGAS